MEKSKEEIFLERLKLLKKDQGCFSYTNEKKCYNNAINDTIELYEEIILGIKKRKYSSGNTGPR